MLLVKKDFKDSLGLKIKKIMGKLNASLRDWSSWPLPSIQYLPFSSVFFKFFGNVKSHFWKPCLMKMIWFERFLTINLTDFIHFLTIFAMNCAKTNFDGVE